MEPLAVLTDTQIGSWVASFMLPLFRIVAVLTTMPIIGTTLVPRRVRMYLGLAITFVVAPVLPPMPPVQALDLSALLLIAEQIIIGVSMGLCLQMFFQVFVVAGQIISTQMGMGFASMVDPANGVTTAVVGQFFTMLVTLMFLAMNGHLVVLEILIESFTTMPVGGGVPVNNFWVLANSLGWIMSAGLRLVLPAVAALLIINIAFGIMTRAAPQLNIFSIGFPMTLVLGMVILWMSLGDIFNQFVPMATDALQRLRDLVRAV